MAVSGQEIGSRGRVTGILQIVLVFLVAAVIVGVGWMLVGDDTFKRQIVVWVANVAMLITIWIGLRVRGETWDHIGLGRWSGGKGAILRALLKSVGVMVFALTAFIAGSMLTVNLAPAAKSADMSGYQYLQGNLPMLLLALAAVYIVSSFGEEVVYRGFLMTRLADLGKRTRLGWTIAAVISAVIFGLAHFDWGVGGILQTTLMGLALAVSYLLVKRNLWILVLAHAYVDTLLLVQMYQGSGAAGG